ncbi:MAG: hypothetical protein ABI863_21780 [Ginsengibacter sp.]
MYYLDNNNFIAFLSVKVAGGHHRSRRNTTVGVLTNLPTGQAGRDMVNEIFIFKQLLR